MLSHLLPCFSRNALNSGPLIQGTNHFVKTICFNVQQMVLFGSPLWDDCLWIYVFSAFLQLQAFLSISFSFLQLQTLSVFSLDLECLFPQGLEQTSLQKSCQVPFNKLHLKKSHHVHFAPHHGTTLDFYDAMKTVFQLTKV